MSQECYLAVDFDGTLCTYNGWKGHTTFGQPIAPMVEQVKQWLEQGIEVKIFTARAADDKLGVVKDAIQDWCSTHIGKRLDVTAEKTFGMIACFCDRSYNVAFNQGIISKDFGGLPEWVATVPLKK